MKVFLIRHAQSEGNIMDLRRRATIAEFNELLSRSPRHPLTSEGVRQARGLAQQLDVERIARLYSSPYDRALTTATIFGEAIGLAPIIVGELREVMPDLQPSHRPEASLRRHYVRSFARMAWSRQGPTWRAEMRRARAAWEIITGEAAAGNVAAVSHGWLITLIVFALRGDPRWRVVRRNVHNAGITTVVSRDA
jgi:broad specificity phosphatase PhoE